MPSSKVGAATVAAAVGALIVTLAQQLGGVEIPAAVQAAIIVLLTFLAGYFVPDVNPAPSSVAAVHQKEAP